MEKITAEGWRHAEGIGPAGQAFVQRWLELSNVLTIDTYRVRHLNLRLAVEELAGILLDVSNFGVDAVNVKEAAAETLRLLKEDSIAPSLLPQRERYYYILTNPLTDPKTVHPSLQILVEQLRSTLNRGYRQALFAAFAEALSNENLEQTVTLTSLLASDVLGEGHDLRNLYWRGAFFMKPPTRTFGEKLSEFIEAYRVRSLRRYSAVFRLQFQSPNVAADMPESVGEIRLTRAVPEATAPASRQFIVTTPRILLARCEVDSCDPFSAARQSAGEIAKALDLLQFTRPGIAIDVPPRSLVVSQSGRQMIVSSAMELLGPMRVAREELAARFHQLAAINVDNDIDLSTKDRIAVGLHYLRRGLSDSAPYGQFLNFWIGFEAVVGGGARANIGDMRRHAARVIAAGYARRVLGDLRANIVRLNATPGGLLGQAIAEEPNVSVALVSLGRALRDHDQFESLVAAAAGSPLLRHRLNAARTTFSSRRHVRTAIARNQEDVSWHIQRMARVRNAIVHGGHVPRDLSTIGSHLATYLWAILRIVIEELSRDPKGRNLRQIFETFAWILDETARLLDTDEAIEPVLLVLVHPQTLLPSSHRE